MARPHRSNTSPDWIARRFKKLERQIRELGSGKRLQAATIGKGGVTVKDEGRVRVLYPSGRIAVDLGPLPDSAGGYGWRVLTDADEGDDGITTALAEIFEIPPGTAGFPDGYKVTRFFGAEIFLVSAKDSASLSAGFTNGGDGSSVAVYDPAVNSTGVNIQSGPGSDVFINGGGSGVRINHDPTGASANCVIDATSGKISRSTSSRRYKQDITEVDVDVDQVLALTPRRYRMKTDVEEHGDDARTYVGFIAEEAEDAGLGDWVTVVDGVPEAFDYDRYVVALQGVVRRQADQISDLTQRLEALEEGAARGTQ